MPAKKHNFTRAEILAGLLVIAAFAVLAGFVVVIQGRGPAEETRRYEARFNNVLGMNPAALVRYGGVTVGRVMDIGPDPKDQSKILVTAEVRADVPVNAKSLATIEQLSLTAERHLEISTGEPKAARIPDGGEIEALNKSGSFVDIPDLDGVIKRVENLLDDAMDMIGVREAKEQQEEDGEAFIKLTDIMKKVQSTLEESEGAVKDVRGAIADNRPTLDSILAKATEIEDGAKELLDELTGMLKENREPLKGTLANVEGITEDAKAILDQVSGELEGLIASIQRTLDNTEGLTANAKSFLDDNRPQLETMLRDLRDSLRHLKAFSHTLSQQPAAVIRGKAPDGRRD